MVQGNVIFHYKGSDRKIVLNAILAGAIILNKGLICNLLWARYYVTITDIKVF